jgi:release factor glutamine methyltransferase
MNIQELLQKSSDKLKKISPTGQLDAEILLAFVLKKSREFILTYPEKKITAHQLTNFNDAINRRFKNEPIAYILGQKEFYGLPFKVTKDTLIPRPETEFLVETAIKKISTIKQSNHLTILDIGTGSGNIIISVVKNIEKQLINSNKIDYFGIDTSQKALAIAKYNAKKNKITNKIKFIQSDLLNYFVKNNLAIKQFNNLIIIANLPYLSKKIYSSCATNVKKFEPRSALLSGTDGLDHYKELFRQIVFLKKDYFMFHPPRVDERSPRVEAGVSCFVEISPEQKKPIEKLIKKYFPLAKIVFQKDLAKKWRVVSFEI